MGASKTLGIVGLSTGWFIPFLGIILGVIGLCLKKEKPDRDVVLNILSIVIAVVAWYFWYVLYFI